MAEMELSVLARQCLGERMSEKGTLQAETAAWEKERNAHAVRIDWRFTQIGPALGVRRPAVCPAEPAAWRRPYRTTATERNKVRATLRGSPALAAAVLVTSLAAGRSCTPGPAPPGGGRRRRSRRRGRPRSAGSAGRPRAGAVRCWIPAAAARCRATAALPECWPTPACNLSSWAPTGRRSC
jgi:hypothetical protein